MNDPRNPYPAEQDLRPHSERHAPGLRASPLLPDVPVPPTADRGFPFSQYSFDLASADFDTVGKRVAALGSRLIYRREGSTPSGRLDVECGGTFRNLYPGSVLDVAFEGLTVRRSASSATTGTAQLIVCARDDADFREPVGSLPLTVATFLAPSAVAGAQVVTSNAVDVSYFESVALQLDTTGTVAGSFSVQVSVNGSSWAEVATATLAGSPTVFDLVVSFPYVRVVFTNTSGTGTLTGYVAGKAA